MARNFEFITVEFVKNVKWKLWKAKGKLFLSFLLLLEFGILLRMEIMEMYSINQDCYLSHPHPQHLKGKFQMSLALDVRIKCQNELRKNFYDGQVLNILDS